MDNMEKEIINIVSSFQQLPYLFVGTGMSMRYAEAPDWNTLLYQIWVVMNTGKTEQEYKRFIQGIEKEIETSKGDISEDEKKYYVNPIVASELRKQFHILYYKDSEFSKEIFLEEEDNEILDKKYDPFKYFIAKSTKRIRLDTSKPDYHEIDDLLKNKNKFAGVITTNYDSVLENLFEEFSVMIGQDNMLLSNSLNIFEIFKIHGCITNPNSLVITEEDYNNFRSKLKYLSAKLLTIFVEHPIIFLGYGMGDVNIRKLFQEIAECLTNEQLEKIRDNFIFITMSTDGNERIGSREIVFGKNNIEMKEIVLKDYSILYKALENIQSSLPIKLARKLQDMVCNYVYSVNATNNILFGTMNSPEIDDSKAAVYFGTLESVRQIGFSTYNIDDILEDILFNNKPYLVNEKLITDTFGNIRKSAGTTLLPIYKYISALKMEIECIPSYYNYIKTYEDIKPNFTDKKHINESLVFDRIEDIEEQFPDHIPKQVAYIKKFASKISVDDLEKYLKKYYNIVYNTGNYSSFKRLIALYDFKKYKQ